MDSVETAIKKLPEKNLHEARVHGPVTSVSSTAAFAPNNSINSHISCEVPEQSQFFLTVTKDSPVFQSPFFSEPHNETDLCLESTYEATRRYSRNSRSSK